MKYYENLIFPSEARAILDVTKAPYFLDSTGQEDCTQKLKNLLNDLLRGMADEMQEVYQTLCESPNGTYLGNENRRLNDRVYAIFPCIINQIPMIYFPNGTYLVSDTISYTLENLKNMMFHYQSGGFELNRCIRMIGQSKDKTIIKLKDNCPGFEFGQQRAVVNFMQGERSNVAMSNYFENMTIDIGKGNPGAVGLVFFANNSGAVRNVKIKSSDEHYAGAVGFWLRNEIASACNVYDLTVEGFQYGIQVSTYLTNAHFENITLLYPQRYGIKIDNNSVQIIGLKAKANVPVLFTAGPMCQVTLANANLESDGTDYTAIKYCRGCIYLRNIQTKGFGASFEKNWFEEWLPDGYIKEYCVRPTYTLYDEKAEGIGLEIKPLPDVASELDFENWCCVNDFGAVGDGVHDDTQAIANAFACGKPVIYFQPGHYLITRPIDIPGTVKHVHYMFCDIYAGEEFSETENEAVFHIVDETNELLFLEKLFAFNGCHGKIRMFRHDSKRTVYMRDMHTQACAFYFNTVPGGEVFFENCACTLWKKAVYGYIPAFEFNGQTVWCHAINPERSMIETINRGGQLWWSGFKTEQEGSINVTTGGGVTEILGGTAIVGHAADIPLIDNQDSDVAAIFSTAGYHDYSTFPIAVRERRGEDSRVIRDTECPQRCWPWYLMPLYSGRGKKK